MHDEAGADRQTAAFAGGPFLPPLSLRALYRPLYHTAQGRSARPVQVRRCYAGRSWADAHQGPCPRVPPDRCQREAKAVTERTVLPMKNTMTASISKELRKEVYRRDGFRCALCDSTDGLQIHHVKPRGRGGADHPMNLITLCWRCHAAAHGSLLMLDEYAPAGATTDAQIRQMMDDLELACVEYVSDYYAEQGEIWYPWEG